MKRIYLTPMRNCLLLQPCDEHVARLLHINRIELVYQNGKYQPIQQQVQFHHYDPQKQIIRTPAMSGPFVQQLLQQHQYECVWTTPQPPNRPQLNPDNLNPQQFRPVCANILRDLGNNPRSGIIVGATGMGKTSIIAGLLKMLPQSFNVLITTENRNVCLQLYQAIRPYMEKEIGLYIPPDIIPGRCLVVNNHALQKLTSGIQHPSIPQLDQFDAWICDEVHRFITPSRYQLTQYLKPWYSWGLTATHERSDQAHLLNEIIFGPVLYRYNHKDILETQQNHGLLPVYAQVHLLESNETVTQDTPLHVRHRRLYLYNESLEVLLTSLVENRLTQNPNECILLFVDTLRQGIIYRNWLDKWNFVFVHGRQPHALRENWLRKFKEGKHTRFIATDIWAEGINVPELQCVIDLSSKYSPARVLQRGGRAARQNNVKTHADYVFFLPTTPTSLLETHIQKIKYLHNMGWDIRFCFSRNHMMTWNTNAKYQLDVLGEFESGIEEQEAVF